MFQNSKSKILVFLLILGIAYGCKHPDLVPDKSTSAESIEVSRAKTWFYNQKITRANFRESTPTDEFYPIWENAEISLLNNGTKIVVVPVWRYAKVEYGEIGFLRRLIVELDVENQPKEGKIYEFIGTKAYLQANKNVLGKQFFDNTLDENAYVVTKSLNEPSIGQNITRGFSIHIGACSVLIYYYDEECLPNAPKGECSAETPKLVFSGLNTKCAGGGGASWIPPAPPVNPTTPDPNGPSGGGAGEVTPPGNIYTQYPSPPTMPNIPPQDPNSPKPPTCLDCPVDNGENTEPVSQVIADIDDIYDVSNSTLTPKQKIKLNELFKSLKKKSCLFGEMIAKMKQAGVKIKFSNNPNMSVGAAFNYEDDSITMNNVSEIALLEELVHAFQFSQNPAGFEAIVNIDINPSQTGLSNIEFEAKLLMNLMNNMAYYGGDTIIGDFEFAISGGVNATNSNVTKRYRTWLKNITANYTKFPTSFTPSQLSSYYGFLQNFRQANFGDMNVIGYFSPANNTKPPTSLFSLTQNSNCKN